MGNRLYLCFYMGLRLAPFFIHYATKNVQSHTTLVILTSFRYHRNRRSMNHQRFAKTPRLEGTMFAEWCGNGNKLFSADSTFACSPSPKLSKGYCIGGSPEWIRRPAGILRVGPVLELLRSQEWTPWAKLRTFNIYTKIALFSMRR